MAKETDNTGTENTEQKKPIPEIKVDDLIKALMAYCSDAPPTDAKAKFNASLRGYLKQRIENYKALEAYNVVFHFDNSTLIKEDADKVYDAVIKFDRKKPILYILYSRGGQSASAYLIGKLLREYCDAKIAIAVPRIAKSAATLLCCVADEIHMGSLSELGPIDPQLDDKPVLGLKNAIDHLAQVVKEHPEAANMLARYMQASVDPIDLGHFERVAESSVQYAEKLLETRKNNKGINARRISNVLVYDYKDHGFVIDKTEAETIFGKDAIKVNTDEYKFSNEIYRTLNLIRLLALQLKHRFYFIGSCDSDAVLDKSPE